MYRETRLPGLGVLWTSRGRPGTRSTIPADGCADLILRDDEVLIAGPSTQWLTGELGETGSAIGLRFLPGLAASALGTNPAELRDLGAPASTILPPAAVDRTRFLLRRAAQDTKDLRHHLAGIVDAAETAAARRWAGAIRSLAARNASLTEASRVLSLSERQLRRRMTATFGYGYATLQRILRAERARSAIVSGLPLVETAQQAGYADQPHLTREFARLVGQTPRSFAARGATAQAGSSGA